MKRVKKSTLDPKGTDSTRSEIAALPGAAHNRLIDGRDQRRLRRKSGRSNQRRQRCWAVPIRDGTTLASAMTSREMSR